MRSVPVTLVTTMGCRSAVCASAAASTTPLAQPITRSVHFVFMSFIPSVVEVHDAHVLQRGVLLAERGGDPKKIDSQAGMREERCLAARVTGDAARGQPRV